MILDLSAVPLADSTAAISLKTFVEKVRGHRARVYITGAVPEVRRALSREGLKVPVVRYAATVAAARASAAHAAD